MNKWIERSITALAIATVVGIVCYQFVYGLDNRSYNWGFNARKNNELNSVNDDDTCNLFKPLYASEKSTESNLISNDQKRGYFVYANSP
jgi:hypothetical protein